MALAHRVMKYNYLHEAVAAAVRRKHPKLKVTGSRPIAGGVNEWKIELEGGTKAERDAAMAYARKFAEGWAHMPGQQT
jgi:hypothetical protein